MNRRRGEIAEDYEQGLRMTFQDVQSDFKSIERIETVLKDRTFEWKRATRSTSRIWTFRQG